MCMKVINNIIRMDYQQMQAMLLKDMSDQIYHLLHFLLSYAEANIDKAECAG